MRKCIFPLTTFSQTGHYRDLKSQFSASLSLSFPRPRGCWGREKTFFFRETKGKCEWGPEKRGGGDTSHDLTLHFTAPLSLILFWEKAGKKVHRLKSGAVRHEERKYSSKPRSLRGKSCKTAQKTAELKFSMTHPLLPPQAWKVDFFRFFFSNSRFGNKTDLDKNPNAPLSSFTPIFSSPNSFLFN